jgi:aldehyde dehydrogenase (NAD+)
MIDIWRCRRSLRQLYGLTIASERRAAMRETWHPLGLCGVISAFNFPVAVWSWNAALALVCGDPVLWKPSEKTPLTALAVDRICTRALTRFGSDAPPALLQVAVGGRDAGEVLSRNPDVALVSATGSVRMGRAVALAVAQRLGRSILELAALDGLPQEPEWHPEGDVFIHTGHCLDALVERGEVRGIREILLAGLKSVYDGLPIGNPLDDGVLVGPLIDMAR